MAAQREPLTIRRIIGGQFGAGLGIVCGLLAALSLGVGITNLRAARQSEQWSTVGGEVVHSEVEEHISVRRDKNDRATTTVTDESNIVYVYRVGGEEYRGQRVRFDWEMDRADAEATVAKYPVGTLVTVYYDPDDPSSAVLEPGGDAYVYKVMIGLGVFFLAIPAAWYAIRALVLVMLPGFKITIDRNMASRVDEAKGLRAKWAACNWIQKTAVVITFPILGAALVGWMVFAVALFYMGVDGYLHPDITQHWTETSGLVVTSEMKPILVKTSDTKGRGGVYHRYDMHIAVEYRVLATRYTMEDRRSLTDEEAAQDLLANYRQGSYVNVYYDPDDPGDAELKPDEPAGLGMAILGALMMAPWLITGLVLLGLWLKKRYLQPARPAGAA